MTSSRAAAAALWLVGLPLCAWIAGRVLLVRPAQHQLLASQQAFLAAQHDELAAEQAALSEEQMLARLKRRVETIRADATRMIAAEASARRNIALLREGRADRSRDSAWAMPFSGRRDG